jgi:2-polyprenyl-3-methyl-5-hydroxy-6-metoxy-1,4-benzoquinol methylase/ribosomal protein S27E
MSARVPDDHAVERMSPSGLDGQGAQRSGALQFVDVGCKLCGSRAHDEVLRDDPWRVVRCAQCAHVYVTPQPGADTLAEHVYDEAYWRSDSPRLRGYADYVADERLYLRTFARRARVIERWFPHSGRVLDIGCAAGYFLRVLRERGWDVQGIEPSSAIARVARESLGPDRIHQGTLESCVGSARFAPRSFDLVTMWDVLEHLPDPARALEHATGWLRIGGRMILETQDVDSFAARTLGRRWHHYKQPEHLHHFSRRSITDLLERHGLRVLEVGREDAGKYVNGSFLVERASRIAPILSRALAPLAPVLPGGIYVNLGDEMIVVAERTTVAAGRAA